jgi:hypothetical protein
VVVESYACELINELLRFLSEPSGLILTASAHDDGAVGHDSIGDEEHLPFLHPIYPELAAARRKQCSLLQSPQPCWEGVRLRVVFEWPHDKLTNFLWLILWIEPRLVQLGNIQTDLHLKELQTVEEEVWEALSLSLIELVCEGGRPRQSRIHLHQKHLMAILIHDEIKSEDSPVSLLFAQVVPQCLCVSVYLPPDSQVESRVFIVRFA